jgi:hypothetical protein
MGDTQSIRSRCSPSQRHDQSPDSTFSKNVLGE